MTVCFKEGGAVDELLHQADSMSFKDNTAIKELLYHALISSFEWGLRPCKG